MDHVLMKSTFRDWSYTTLRQISLNINQ